MHTAARASPAGARAIAIVRPVGSQVIAAILLAVGASAVTPPLDCPKGATLVSRDISDGMKSEMCVSSGARVGPYAERLANGQRVVWGRFESDHEQGVWTMDVVKEGKRQIVFVMFDQGKDITLAVLRDIPPHCSTWNALSNVGRAGALARLSDLVLDELTGRPAELVSDRGPVAACIAQAAEGVKYTSPMDCAKGEDVGQILQDHVIELASDCALRKTGR